MSLSVNLAVDNDRGSHVYFRVFMGPNNHNRLFCGSLCTHKEEFFALVDALRASPELELTVTPPQGPKEEP